MKHGLSVAVMIVMGLVFTSCTATVMQQWALARLPATAATGARPPSAADRRQALSPAKTTEECLPGQSGDPQSAAAPPKFTPVRGAPKN